MLEKNVTANLGFKLITQYFKIVLICVSKL